MPKDDSERADEFRTPHVSRALPRRDGPKVLEYRHPWTFVVYGQLETLVEARQAHDLEDARALLDEEPAWLAILLGCTADDEAAVVEFAAEARAHDEHVPILLSTPVASAELTARAVVLDAHVIVESEEAGLAVVAFLQRAVERRGGIEDRLVRSLMNVYGLSVQDARVVRLTLAGERRADIAEMLFLSPNTVDSHAEKIRKKIGRPLKTLRGREVEQLLDELEAKVEKARRAPGK